MFATFTLSFPYDFQFLRSPLSNSRPNRSKIRHKHKESQLQKKFEVNGDFYCFSEHSIRGGKSDTLKHSKCNPRTKIIALADQELIAVERSDPTGEIIALFSTYISVQYQDLGVDSFVSSDHNSTSPEILLSP